MCGIAGIISVDKNEISSRRLEAMTQIIAHRGPDGEKQWISENGNVGFGHRRLSIIDLSHNGDQPMHYLGRYTIVFNGEIYNYVELKQKLVSQGYKFNTESDTEVLIALYDREKENCLQLLDGMFSFVIYDNVSNEIFAARDRFGEKPLFYSFEEGSHFLFASEMKSLWAAGIDKDINYSMMFNYLSYGEVENQKNQAETFYQNCTRLPHSHYLKLSVTDCRLTTTKYYDIYFKNINYSISEAQAQQKFRELFSTSVSRRLRSDVTVGSSLSGGLDSSLVVCVIDELRKGTTQKQETFSAVFPGFIKDERKYIDYVLNKTNVSPHFITPDDGKLIDELENLFYHQEEPFGSASIYVQYCVMRLAKENKVTVLLDGQGADEYLAGYHPYYATFFNELRSADSRKFKEEFARYKNLHTENNINPEISDLKNYVKYAIPGLIKPAKAFLNYYQQKKSPFFSPDFYEQYRNNNQAPEYDSKTLNGALYRSIFEGGLQTLLRYADRNSMAQSREVRLPFLYHELVEFVFSLPSHFKIHDGWTKWIMRSAFQDVLPEEIAWRKSKIGFEPPQKSWMENAAVKEKIQESKRKLYQHNVISKQEFEKEPAANSAASGSNKSWSLWMAGNMFS